LRGSVNRQCSNRAGHHDPTELTYLHPQSVDTTTPSGKVMFQMMGVFAEFERAMISEAEMDEASRVPEAQEEACDPSLFRRG
jgi:hypothetical protein